MGKRLRFLLFSHSFLLTSADRKVSKQHMSTFNQLLPSPKFSILDVHWPGAQTSLRTADPPSLACCKSHPGCRERAGGTSNSLPWGRFRRNRPLRIAYAHWPRTKRWAGRGFSRQGAGWVSQRPQAWATQRLEMWKLHAGSMAVCSSRRLVVVKRRSRSCTWGRVAARCPPF